jgi:hypothetical protein
MWGLLPAFRWAYCSWDDIAYGNEQGPSGQFSCCKTILQGVVLWGDCKQQFVRACELL